MTEAEKLANEAMAAWQDAYWRANGKPAPLMRYERGWILRSCSSDRMMFPTRLRRRDVEAHTSQLEWRIRRDAQLSGGGAMTCTLPSLQQSNGNPEGVR